MLKRLWAWLTRKRVAIPDAQGVASATGKGRIRRDALSVLNGTQD